MGETETLIIDEIQSIVSDQLQVVSYKWLSRNFSVSSNAAKRLLHEFVEKFGNGLEVIYSVSGMLKDSPSMYHVRLVSKRTLSDAKQEFDGHCSIQIYSVQACLPKDSATLWNHEFVQAEDLFKQPPTVDNCLRSNMLCGVSSSFIERNHDRKASSTATPPVNITKVSDLFKSNNARQTPSVPQPQLKKVQTPSPNLNNVKIDNHAKKEQVKNGQFAPHKEKVPQVIPDKKKNQSDKKSSSSGSALAGMWGRVSTKSKADIPLEQPNDSRQKSAATADAQISAREVECESSDEDGQDFKVNRGSGSSRNRRVMLDYSDEDDEFKDAVSLASPDPPKKSTPVTKKSSVTEISLNFNEEKKNEPNSKEVKETGVKPNKAFMQEISETNKGKKEGPRISDNISSHARETDDKRTNMTNAVHKKRKVIKTRIDERGREVTEVVWEGGEPDTKPDPKPENIVEKDTVNNASTSFRSSFVKKSPSVGNSAPANQTGKTGNKKGGKKDPKPTDPKQGNILSFFKKA